MENLNDYSVTDLRKIRDNLRADARKLVFVNHAEAGTLSDLALRIDQNIIWRVGTC